MIDVDKGEDHNQFRNRSVWLPGDGISNMMPLPEVLNIRYLPELEGFPIERDRPVLSDLTFLSYYVDKYLQPPDAKAF